MNATEKLQSVQVTDVSICREEKDVNNDNNDHSITTTTTTTTTTDDHMMIPQLPHNAFKYNYWIDQYLDYVRDHPLHPILETILAWIVAVLCLIYYGYQYISSSSSLLWYTRTQQFFTTTTSHSYTKQQQQQQQQQRKRIPLMTEANTRISSKQRMNNPIIQVQQLYYNISQSFNNIIILQQQQQQQQQQDIFVVNHDQPNHHVRYNNMNHISDLTTFLDKFLQCYPNDDDENTIILLLFKDTLIQAIRTNATLRRQVSQYTMIMTSILQQQPPPPSSSSSSSTEATGIERSDYSATANTIDPTSSVQDGITVTMQQLYSFFDSIWTDLLRLPDIDDNSSSTLNNNTNNSTYPYNNIIISVIIPLYKECGINLIQTTLRIAKQYCNDPSKIQIILVDAGQCQNVHIIHEYINQQQQQQGSNSNTNYSDRHMNGTQQESQSCCHPKHYYDDTNNNWGYIQYVIYENGGGRGPCQNYGAQLAKGKYITFLHSDTLLPLHWDIKICNTLNYHRTTSTTSNKNSNNVVITHACSFSVGHNVSREGLGPTMRYPYGIRSILLLGNIRAWLFRLPYGDHILSFHTLHFHYIGGFPNQPIMEDYVIMDLLRQRAAASTKISQNVIETLRIIPPPTGLCSVRRWQMYGVVYVTLVNALIVHRYVYGGWTADDVFEYYYLRPLKQKTN